MSEGLFEPPLTSQRRPPDSRNRRSRRRRLFWRASKPRQNRRVCTVARFGTGNHAPILDPVAARQIWQAPVLALDYFGSSAPMPDWRQRQVWPQHKYAPIVASANFSPSEHAPFPALARPYWGVPSSTPCWRRLASAPCSASRCGLWGPDDLL